MQLACSDEQIKNIYNPERYVFATSSNEYVFYLDKLTLKEVSKGIYKIWDIQLATMDGRESEINFAKKHGKQSQYINYGYEKQLFHYDIINDKFSSVSITKYNCNLGAIETIQGDETFRHIVPESVMEDMANVVKELAKKQKHK